MESMRTINTAADVQVKTKKEPKRLSKLGEWMRKPDRGYLVINDMKAVLK